MRLEEGQVYDVLEDSRDNTTICFNVNVSYSQGLWRMTDTLTTSLPMLILQLTLIMLLSRLLHLLFRHLRFPLFISELLAGIIMGPSGGIDDDRRMFMGGLAPYRGNRVLETIANLGVVYYMFLVGLEMDATPILRTGPSVMTLAIAGAAVPGAIGALLYTYLFSRPLTGHDMEGLFFWAITLAVTSFPDVTRDLARRKVLLTDLGKTALSTAVINDLLSWLMLVIAIALVSDDYQYMAVVSTTGFVAMCVFAVRPAMVWLTKQSGKREECTDYHLCLVLTGVSVCGFITELCGSHSMVGAFMFGLVIPNGELARTLKSRLEDYVAATMLPLFYVISGFRFSTKHLYECPDGYQLNHAQMFCLVFIACSAKVLTTFVVSLMFKHSPKDSLALGFFLNTKGILALIVLNTGRNNSALDNQTYSIMMIAIMVMTAMPVPATFFLRTSRRSGLYRRTIQTPRWSEVGELRFLACIHSTRNVTPLINLLQSTEATKDSPICVYGVHLIELTGRASAMIIMHNTSSKKNNKLGGGPQEESDHIISALENYEMSSEATTVYPLTVVSPYNTMHDDISRVAEERFAAMILVPFHKLPTADGGLKEDNVSVRDVNLNILKTAPCSVGILVDRGFGLIRRTESSIVSDDVSRRYAMFFQGGADDREALAFAWKMSRNPGVNLTVVRFIPEKGAADFSKHIFHDDDEDESGILTAITDQEVQKHLDDDYITEFRNKNVDQKTVHYTEKVANCGDDTIAAIKDMEDTYELFILGRGGGVMSPFTSGLAHWSDTPELGLVGDAVVQSDFAMDVSVLVVQQYNPEKLGTSNKEPDHKSFDTSILDD